MKQLTINSRVEGGRLRRNREKLKRIIESFEGKDITITIKRKFKQRSLPQNAAYWGLTIPFFQDLLFKEWGEWYDTEDVHSILKQHCNYTEKVNQDTGEVIKIARNTKDLTTAEFTEYQGKIDDFCMNFFKCVPPKPDDQLTFFDE